MSQHIGIDENDVTSEDPCVRAAALRKELMRMISGRQESEFEYSGNGVTRRARYSQGDLAALRGELREAEAQCAASQGLPAPRRRYAIQAGHRRPK